MKTNVLVRVLNVLIHLLSPSDTQKTYQILIHLFQLSAVSFDVRMH